MAGQQTEQSSHTGQRQRRISVCNAKGGVGKSLVATNLAGALAARGRDVLLVDLDPQGNATESLGGADEYESDDPTILQALASTRREIVNDLILSGGEMDLLPSNLDLLYGERSLTVAELVCELRADGVEVDTGELATRGRWLDPDAFETSHAKEGLDRALSAVETEYDYVIIDTPPFYGQLTSSALFAAPNVVVPALTESTSQRAVVMLLRQAAAVEEETGTDIDVIGVAANRVEATGEDDRMLEWLDEAFSDAPIWKIRKRVGLQRAFKSGESIVEHDPDSDMVSVFESMARDIEAVFDGRESEVSADV